MEGEDQWVLDVEYFEGKGVLSQTLQISVYRTTVHSEGKHTRVQAE